MTQVPHTQILHFVSDSMLNILWHFDLKSISAMQTQGFGLSLLTYFSTYPQL